MFIFAAYNEESYTITTAASKMMTEKEIYKFRNFLD